MECLLCAVPQLKGTERLLYVMPWTAFVCWGLRWPSRRYRYLSLSARTVSMPTVRIPHTVPVPHRQQAPNKPLNKALLQLLPCGYIGST